MEIFFVDQEQLCYFDGDKVKKFKSKYIENYRQTAERIAKSRSWLQAVRRRRLSPAKNAPHSP